MMNPADPIEILRSALMRISEPRLFETERGYQAELLAEIQHVLKQQKDDFTRPFAESEYQKRLDAHGVRFRPDIIVHVPYNRGVSPTRRHDNYLVVMLKLAAEKGKADEDFGKLARLCTALDYPVGALVNLGTTELWLPQYNAEIEGEFTLFEFAVTLCEGQPKVEEGSRKFGGLGC